MNVAVFQQNFFLKNKQRAGFDLWASWLAPGVDPHNSCSFSKHLPLLLTEHLTITASSTFSLPDGYPCPGPPFCWSWSCTFLKLSKAICLLLISPLTIYYCFSFFLYWEFIPFGHLLPFHPATVALWLSLFTFITPTCLGLCWFLIPVCISFQFKYMCQKSRVV